MKKRYFSSILLAMMVANGYAQSSALGNQMTAQQRSKLNIALLGKISELRMNYAAKVRSQGNDAQKADESQKVRVLIEVAADADPVSVLQQHDVEPVAHVFQFAEAQMTPEQIGDMAADEQVVRMELPQKQALFLNKANADTGVSSIHAGENLSTPYTGKGVLALVEDNGFAPDHKMMLNEDGTTKVEYLCDVDGNAYTTDETIKAYRNAKGDHGTFVISTLAGSKVTGVDHVEYEGAAPGVSLALFETKAISEETVLKPMQRLAEYLSSKENDGRPKVLSFSTGMMSNVTSDGTDILCSVLAKIAEKWPVCVASGNEGKILFFEDYNFTSTAKIRLAASGSAYKASTTKHFYLSTVDNQIFKANLVLTDDEYNDLYSIPIDVNLNGEIKCLSSVESDQDADVIRNDIFTRDHPNARVYFTSKKTKNGYQVFLTIENFTFEEKDGKVVIEAEGKEGQLIRSCGYYTDNSSWTFLNSDGLVMRDRSADGYGNALAFTPGVISVGAYYTNKPDEDDDDDELSLVSSAQKNTIWSETSYRTETKGGQIPFICAPGAMVTAAYNRWYSDFITPSLLDIEGSEDKLTSGEGTSIATPYMAGVIALWLEANPKLTPADIKDIIAKTARKDEDVLDSDAEIVKWGYGKVDAYAGLKEALNRTATSLHAISQDKDFMWRKGATDGQLEAYVAGETALTARLVNMEGKVVAQAHQPGNTITLTAPQHAKGVYVLEVMGQGKGTSHKAKIVIR